MISNTAYMPFNNSTELENRLKFVLAANMPITEAIQRSSAVLKTLKAKDDGSEQFLAKSLAVYFVKGDFFRVILQEALSEEHLEGFLRFLRVLDEVWQEVDPAKVKPNRVIMGDQVRDQGLVGDDMPGRKRARGFFSALVSADEATVRDIKAYLHHQIRGHVGTATLAYDGSSIFPLASPDAIKGQLYMMKLIK